MSGTYARLPPSPEIAAEYHEAMRRIERASRWATMKRFLRLQGLFFRCMLRVMKERQAVKTVIKTKTKTRRVYLIAPTPKAQEHVASGPQEAEWGRQWWQSFQAESNRSFAETVETAGLGKRPETPSMNTTRKRPSRPKAVMKHRTSEKTSPKGSKTEVEV